MFLCMQTQRKTNFRKDNKEIKSEKEIKSNLFPVGDFCAAMTRLYEILLDL